VDELGLVAYATGSRPSSLFLWDESDDWNERLVFDALVLQQAMPKLLAMQQMGGVVDGRGDSQDLC
jgi:hypothetical protein